jgi:hypothetical protein
MTGYDFGEFERLGEWTYRRLLKDTQGLVLRDVRHAEQLFVRDIRVVGIRAGRISSISPMSGRTVPLQLGAPELPVIGKFYPGQIPDLPDDVPPGFGDVSTNLIFEFPNPQALGVVYRTQGPVLGQDSGTEALTIRQTYVLTAYGKDPPHEPGALVNAARLYPLVTFRYPTCP